MSEPIGDPSPPPELRRRYAEIDILRGFAAFWVLLSHYLPYWDKYFDPVVILVPNSWGIYAVKLFFVISGFVIFTTLGRCRSVLDFAVLRFSRLYPTYWATLLLATLAGVGLFGAHLWFNGLLVNLTMFQEFLGVGNFDNVYWSLTVELAFYLNVAWLFALGWHRRPLTVVVGWLALTALWTFSPHIPGTDHRGWMAKLFAFDYAPYFAMGIVFFVVSRQGWSIARGALIALALGTEFLITGWKGLGVALVVGLLFALAINGSLKFLVSRPTLWLGSISYSLYLLHRNLGYESLTWLHDHGIAPSLAVPLVTAGVLALSTAVTLGVEQPAMRRIRVWYSGWQARKATGG